MTVTNHHQLYVNITLSVLGRNKNQRQDIGIAMIVMDVHLSSIHFHPTLHMEPFLVLFLHLPHQ